MKPNYICKIHFRGPRSETNLYRNVWRTTRTSAQFRKFKPIKFSKLCARACCPPYISIHVCFTPWSPKVNFAYIIRLHFFYLQKLYPVYYEISDQALRNKIQNGERNKFSSCRLQYTYLVYHWQRLYSVKH